MDSRVYLVAYWDCVKIASSACGKLAAAAPKIVHVAPWMLAAYMAAHPLPAGECASDCHWVIPKEEFAPGGMFGSPLQVPGFTSDSGAPLLPTAGAAPGGMFASLPHPRESASDALAVLSQEETDGAASGTDDGSIHETIPNYDPPGMIPAFTLGPANSRLPANPARPFPPVAPPADTDDPEAPPVPIPEPSTLAVLMVSLSVLWRIRSGDRAKSTSPTTTRNPSYGQSGSRTESC